MAASFCSFLLVALSGVSGCSAGQEVCVGLVAGHTSALLHLPLVGQGQVEAWVGQGGVGVVVVLLQVLLEETVVREVLLEGRSGGRRRRRTKKRCRNTRSTLSSFETTRQGWMGFRRKWD